MFAFDDRGKPPATDHLGHCRPVGDEHMFVYTEGRQGRSIGPKEVFRCLL